MLAIAAPSNPNRTAMTMMRERRKDRGHPSPALVQNAPQVLTAAFRHGHAKTGM